MMSGLPWWLSGEESTASAGDSGLTPGPGGSRMPCSSLQLLSLRPRARDRNYRACALGLGTATSEPAPWGSGPATTEPTCAGARAPQQEKPLQRKITHDTGE